MFMKYKNCLTIALFLILGLAIFFQPVFKGFFLGDDWWLINETSPRLWLNSFSGNWINGVQGEGGFYRPIVKTSFFVDSILFATSPAPYHITNLLLHVANASLIFLLASLLLANFPLSLIAGLLFLAFPLSHEPVCWIAARTTLIVTFFILLSTYLFILHSRQKSHTLYLLSLLFYMLGLLSKESALVVPIFFIIYYLSSAKQNSQPRPLLNLFRLTLPFILIALIYLLIRYASLGYWISGYGTELESLSISRAYETLYSYIVRLAVPAPHNIDPLRISNLAPDWRISILIAVFILILVIFPPTRPCRFLTLWLIVSILPFISYPHLARFYYLPAAIFCLLFASVIAYLLPKNNHQRTLRYAFIAFVSATLFIYYSHLLFYLNANWVVASHKVRNFISNAADLIEPHPQPFHYFFFQDSMEIISGNPLTHFNGSPMLHFDFPAIAVNKIFAKFHPNLEAHWGIPADFENLNSALAVKIYPDFSLIPFRLTAKTSYVWNFYLSDEQWFMKNDLVRMRSPFNYPKYFITADFPYLQSPLIKHPHPAFATVQFDIKTYRIKQPEAAAWLVFYDPNGKKNLRESPYNFRIQPTHDNFDNYEIRLGFFPNIQGLIFNPTIGRFSLFETRYVDLHLFDLEPL
jgi:hypothetical protein